MEQHYILNLYFKFIINKSIINRFNFSSFSIRIQASIKTKFLGTFFPFIVLLHIISEINPIAFDVLISSKKTHILVLELLFNSIYFIHKINYIFFCNSFMYIFNF